MFEKFIYWRFKEAFKYFTNEDQRYLYLQNKHYFIIETMSFLMIAFIILALEEIYVVITQNFVAIMFVALIGGITIFFTSEIFVAKMTKKLYPIIITKRGKAISKKDFKVIKKASPTLYDTIMSEKCCGQCYFVSWVILQILRKGYIQFVAVKHFYELNEEKKEQYKIHVIYVNKDWCFDTYSQRQMPVKELCEIWRGKLIDKYDYSAIKGKEFEEFRDSIAPKLRKWCNENNCANNC